MPRLNINLGDLVHRSQRTGIEEGVAMAEELEGDVLHSHRGQESDGQLPAYRPVVGVTSPFHSKCPRGFERYALFSALVSRTNGVTLTQFLIPVPVHDCIHLPLSGPE
jgi:hypothetical protein